LIQKDSIASGRSWGRTPQLFRAEADAIQAGSEFI
jgi:hypothetical protein